MFLNRLLTEKKYIYILIGLFVLATIVFLFIEYGGKKEPDPSPFNIEESTENTSLEPGQYQKRISGDPQKIESEIIIDKTNKTDLSKSLGSPYKESEVATGYFRSIYQYDFNGVPLGTLNAISKTDGTIIMYSYPLSERITIDEAVKKYNLGTKSFTLASKLTDNKSHKIYVYLEDRYALDTYEGKVQEIWKYERITQEDFLYLYASDMEIVSDEPNPILDLQLKERKIN